MGEKEQFILIFTGVWSLIGIIFLMGSLIISSVQKRKAKVCTSKTVGTVVDVIWKSGSDPKYSSWHHVVQYTAATGQTVNTTYAYGTNPSKYETGQTVHIRYNPHNPHEFYIAGDKTAKIVQIVFLCVGIGGILIGVSVGTLVWFLW